MDDLELGPVERSWGAAVKASAVEPCLTATQLIEFVEKGPSAAGFGSYVQHLSVCPTCRSIVQEMRSAEAEQIHATGKKKVWFPLAGSLKPIAFLGVAAALAAGSAVVLTNGRPFGGARKPNSAGSSSVAMVTAPPSLDIVPARPDPHTTKPGSRPITAPVIGGPKPVTATKPAVGGGPSPVPKGVPGKKEDPIEGDDPALSDTSQLYCLVGSDGVFAMPSKNAKLHERQEIEESYADRVAVAKTKFDEKIAAKEDPAAATEDYKKDLTSAGEERDKKLGAIFTRTPYLREKYPELNIRGNGPYQVVQINLERNVPTPAPVSFVVLPPWPSYQPVNSTFNWRFGVAYAPTQFRQYVMVHNRAAGPGGRAFYGLVGHSHAVVVDNVYSSSRSGFIVRPTHSYTHSTPSAYVHGSHVEATASRSTSAPHVTPPLRTHYVGEAASATRSRPAEGLSHFGVAAPSGTSGGGYSHSGFPGGYSRSATAVRPGGGYSRSTSVGTRDSGYSRATTAAPHEPYSHSGSGSVRQPIGGGYSHSGSTSGYGSTELGGSRYGVRQPAGAGYRSSSRSPRSPSSTSRPKDLPDKGRPHG
jgi:hypothetical protein